MLLRDTIDQIPQIDHNYKLQHKLKKLISKFKKMPKKQLKLSK